MKFLISRTSEWGDKQPYKNAYLETFARIDERVVDDPSKLNYKPDRENWYSNGSNHRVENGHIKRDFVSEGWFINLNSLEELLEFKKEVGEDIVIQDSWMNDGILEIEIYDTYRE